MVIPTLAKWLIGGVLGGLTVWAVTRTSAVRASFLFVTDTHGAGVNNRGLVDALVRETGHQGIVHGGDIADAPQFWRPWWDQAFARVRGPWYPVTGNHDVDGEDNAAEFRRRFPQGLPRVVHFGSTDVFLMPWRAGYYDWLQRKVEASDAKYKVLVRHLPVWSARGEASDEARLRESLKKIDLVLVGHNHVFWDSYHDVDGHRVRQIIEVSGPKHYECSSEAAAAGCTSGTRGYLRIDETASGLRVTRQEVE